MIYSPNKPPIFYIARVGHVSGKILKTVEGLMMKSPRVHDALCAVDGVGIEAKNHTVNLVTKLWDY